MRTGQQPVGRTRAATAAQAGGSGDSGQRAKWVRLMMLLRLRERFSCWAGFRLVLTRKGIDAMYKAYKKRRKKGTDTGEDEAETSADESRADPGTGEPESRRHRPRGNVGKRHEEGGDLNRLWRTRRQTTQGRRCGGGADAQGETNEGGTWSRTLRRSAGGCTKRLIKSSRDPRYHVEDG